jgi:hypothetical protein
MRTGVPGVVAAATCMCTQCQATAVYAAAVGACAKNFITKADTWTTDDKLRRTDAQAAMQAIPLQGQEVGSWWAVFGLANACCLT